MWLMPVAMGTAVLAAFARVAVATIDEQLPLWAAAALAVVIAAWPTAVTIRARRRYSARLAELGDPLFGSALTDQPLAPLPLLSRVWLLGTPVLVLVAVGLAVNARGLGNTCVTKGIATAAAREGTCLRGGNLFGGGVTYTVVDAGRVLSMPGFDARLLATTTRIGPVSNAAQSPDFYPNGFGTLVCLKVAITNRGSTTITYDSSGTDVWLLLQNRDSAAGAGSYYFPDVPEANEEPNPSLAALPPIQPGQTVVGWVAFVAPQWALQTLNARATDLEFLLPSNGHGGPNAASYIGQIRLWKAAGTAGKRALADNPNA